jgi:hypothetical protein
MIKLLGLIICLITAAGCATDDHFNEWRASLVALKEARISVSDDGSGLEAYANLMQSGERGFRVISNSWAYDDIIEERWIQWEHDFYTRYFLPTDVTRYEITGDYRAFLENRLLHEKVFFKAAANRLASINGYKTFPLGLANWLDVESLGKGIVQQLPLGHRKVAYLALQEMYPELPQFTPDATSDIRKDQFNSIVEFIKTQTI